MKALILDVSYNSSRSEVNRTLQRNRDAVLIYAFDSQIYMYDSIHDLEADIRYDTEFFTRAGAYYDMVISILSDIRQYPASEIVICSPRIDNCSRFTTKERFNNYIRHFNLYNNNLFPTDCKKYNQFDTDIFAPKSNPVQAEKHHPSKGINKFLDWILEASSLS